MSDTSGMFKAENGYACFFDLTTMKITELNLIFNEFHPMSETSGIFDTNNDETYFFDSTKINQPNKGLTKIEADFRRYLCLSDTLAVF